MAAKYLKSLGKEELKYFFGSFDTVLSDCDGVLWLETDAISGSPDAVNKLKEAGKNFFYVTNNNTKTRAEFLQKCQGLKYNATLEEVMCTSYLAAMYLKEKGFNKKVYIIGSNGIGKELESVGIKHIGIGPDVMTCSSEQAVKDFQPDPEVGAVVIGFDEHFSYPKLIKAATYLKDPKVHFIGTNIDSERPSPNSNKYPGSGVFVRAVEAVVNRKAVMLGKPEPFISEVVIEKYGLDPARTLMIGDKGDTDILLGKRCGFKTLLVLSGVTTAADMKKFEKSNDKAERELVPDYYTDQLSDIIPLLASV